MIYPTRRAVLLAALGAPLGLVLALLGGQLWLLGLAWAAAVVAALVADGLLGANPLGAEIGFAAPEAYFLGRPASAEVTVRFARLHTFEAITERVKRRPRSAPDIFMVIVEALIDYGADRLEELASMREQLSAPLPLSSTIELRRRLAEGYQDVATEAARHGDFDRAAEYARLGLEMVNALKEDSSPYSKAVAKSVFERGSWTNEELRAYAERAKPR